MMYCSQMYADWKYRLKMSVGIGSKWRLPYTNVSAVNGQLKVFLSSHVNGSQSVRN